MIINIWWECGIVFEMFVLFDVRRMSFKFFGLSWGKLILNFLVYKLFIVYLIDDFLFWLKRIKCFRVGILLEFVLLLGYVWLVIFIVVFKLLLFKFGFIIKVLIGVRLLSSLIRLFDL